MALVLSPASNRQIEAAFSQMEDAQCWTSNISSAATTKNIWFQTWPGWIWGTYDYHADHGLDEWLADLLPLSSTFTGHLDGAEALYDGSNHNLIGVRNFLSGTPQLAVLLGMTRAGKSAFMCDLLSQTDPYYDFTLILEEGLSYDIWTQALGGTPIVIRPDGDLTLNYLDTQGAPLTNLQITTAAALVAKMAGQPADEERISLRLAQITQYVEQLYTDRFEEWVSENASRLDLVARHAMDVAEFKTARLPMTATFLEAWTEFQHAASADERESLIKRWKPEEVSRFLKSPDTERLVRNTTFAFFRPDALKYAWEKAQWADKLATLHNTLTTVREHLETANLVKQAIGDPVAAIALIDSGLFSDFLQDSGIADTLTDLAGIAAEGVQLSATIQELFEPIDISTWADVSSLSSFESVASFRDPSDPFKRFRAVENAYSRFEVLLLQARSKRQTLKNQIVRLSMQLKNAKDDAEVQNSLVRSRRRRRL